MASVVRGVVALLAFVAPVAGVAVGARALELGSASGLKERPVMKVVRLLQDMKAQLEKELDDDKAVHESLSCWCKDNDREKTEAIALGEAREEQLKAFLGEAWAKMAELKVRRKATWDELQSDHAALDQATKLRIKDNQNFHSGETDYLDAIDACKNAITVLSKHHPQLAQLRSIAQRLLDPRVAQVMRSTGALDKAKAEALRSFVQAAQGASSFLSIPGFQSYSPQSGQIFGILKQMLEDFEANLSEEQKAELKAKQEYEALKTAKQDQIATGERTIIEIDADFADWSEKHAQASQELEDTQAQLDLDRTFLANLKKKCSETDAEFDRRVKSRTEEIAAVEDTIKILNTDPAFDVFDRTVNGAFLQTGRTSQEEQKRRQQAVAVLQRVAQSSGEPQLSLLAASAQLDAFTKVKELIDKLTAELTKQQKEEVAHRDWCIDELNRNNRSTEAGNDKRANLEVKIDDLKKTIASLTKDIDTSKAAVAEMQNQMKRASENREAENADYQQTITDHRVTQIILEKALDRMKQVYAMLQQQPGAPHIWTSGNHTDPGNGPARFTKYAQHAGGSRVVQMLETIIGDSRKTEDETIESEQDSQTAYEDFMKDSNKAILTTSKSITNMSAARAKANAALSMAKTDLKMTMQELEGLSQYLGDLTKSCDFLLRNFDARQAARAAEIDALQEAKAILSGAK